MSTTSPSNLRTLAAAGVIAIVAAAAGYGLAQLKPGPSTASEASAPGGKKVLYWYDPMVPQQHFPAPGKSPMGMDMVPKYANEGAGQGEAGFKIDPAKVAKDGNPTTGTVAAFLETNQVGDIVAVNGRPAKGLYQSVAFIMPFRANPTAGQAIADLDSSGFFHCSWEILGPDGAYIGTLLDGGANTGHGLLGGNGASWV